MAWIKTLPLLCVEKRVCLEQTRANVTMIFSENRKSDGKIIVSTNR